METKLYFIKRDTLEGVQVYIDSVNYHLEHTAIECVNKGDVIKYKAILDKAERVISEIDKLMNLIDYEEVKPRAEWEVIKGLECYSKLV